MAFELIAALVAAVGLAGVALMIRRLTGGRPGKWFVSAMAGLGLIATTIVLEYGWQGRVQAELPEGMAVVWEGADPQPLRPWSYLWPLVTQFSVLDTREMAAHPAQGHLRMARIYNFARWRGVDEALMVFDCAGAQRVLLVDGAMIDEAGELTGATWSLAPAGDAMQALACGEG